jgi:hypothetical protein
VTGWPSFLKTEMNIGNHIEHVENNGDIDDDDDDDDL